MRKTLTSAVLILLGAGFTVWGAGVLASAFATRGWPTAAGVILQSAIEEYVDSDQETMYTARVEYRYTVAGREYRSRRMSLGDHSSSSRSQMQSRIARYPAGSSVAVFYDPEQPSSALLRPGPVWINHVPLAFGLLCVGFGAFTLVVRKGESDPRLHRAR